MIATILNIIHLLLYVLVIIPFITNNKKILTFYLHYLLFVFLGWLIFDNKCWLTILEDKITKKNMIDNNGNSLVYRIYNLTNIKLSEFFIDILLRIVTYLSILVLTYKLNIYYYGIIWILSYEIFLKVIN